ncbi:MAG: DUF1080 domain-containing protein [Ginsengibacter sp.]
MIKNLSWILIILFAVGCNASKSTTMNKNENKLSKAETADGWQILFDGQSPKGWHSYGQKTAGKAWVINEGALHLNSKNKSNLAKEESGDLVTDNEYSNFHLKMDWKISDKGNSGIIFYIHEDPSKYGATYQTGLEMQVLDNGTPTRLGHPDGKLYTHRTGDLYDLLAAKEAEKPLGEWNHAEIKSVNGQLDFYLNGEHTLSTKIWDQNWNEMVAISKFKDMPGFGKYKSGKIALQDHGDDVWYKNIKIKRL